MANTSLITALTGCSGRSMPDPALFEKALFLNVYTANQEIREQLLSCAGIVISAEQIPGPVKQAFYQLAVEQIEAQKKATPNDARIYVLGGMFINSIIGSGTGKIADAVSLFEKANELSPNKQSIILPLAIDYINSDKQDKALTILKEAYESATNNDKIKSTYIMALVIVGKEDEARKVSGDDSFFQSEQMAELYASLKQYSKSISIFKDLIKANPKDINLQAKLAQIQYLLGDKWTAIETLRAITKENPELKDQIEAAIKNMK